MLSFPTKVINQLVDFFNMVFRYWDQRCFAKTFRDNKRLYNLNFSYQGKASTFPATAVIKVPWIDLKMDSQFAFNLVWVS